jgi:multidrug efflux system membrane fusion protein
VTAPVARQAMPVQIEGIGTVQPIATAVVKSRIDGQIAKVVVRDGQEVKAGDVIMTLDARALEAQTRQADAQLAKDRAQLANAKREAGRQAELAAKNYASQAVADTAQTNVAALEASVHADEAALDNIKVQLSYCTIVSPIDGKAGAIALKEGNNVKANDTITLVTINQLHPIYVAFSAPERELPAIREARTARELDMSARAPGEPVSEKGKLAFIDNAVDTTTGTIMLRGIFDNSKNRLWPGQFVKAKLTLRVEPDALVLPSQAVQVGQSSSYVFVVKSDNTVEQRDVTVARSAGEEVVIAKGLAEGELVVIDGQLRLTRGSKVEPRPMPKEGSAGAGS